MKIPKQIMQPGTPNKLWKDKVFQVVQRDGAKCKNCGLAYEEALTVDHINPRVLGGGDDIENLQILCRRCHYKKDRNLPKEMRDKGIIYVKEKPSDMERFKGSLWHKEKISSLHRKELPDKE